MADTEDAFKDIDKIIDGLKERSPKSKEYCKFLISLSTGTLIFSVTLSGVNYFFPLATIIIPGFPLPPKPLLIRCG